MPERIVWFIGVDAGGDFCVYFKVIDDDNNFVRYLDEEEITELLRASNVVAEDGN